LNLSGKVLLVGGEAFWLGSTRFALCESTSLSAKDASVPSAAVLQWYWSPSGYLLPWDCWSS